jgi:hypothetical protein
LAKLVLGSSAAAQHLPAGYIDGNEPTQIWPPPVKRKGSDENEPFLKQAVSAKSIHKSVPYIP